MSEEPAIEPTSDQVRAYRFPIRRTGERLRLQNVDELVELAAHALWAWETGRPLEAEVTPDEILQADIPIARGLACGYDPDEVDVYLDGIVQALREHERVSQ